MGENLLPKINLTVSLLKRWLLGTHQGAVRPQHLDYYLDEFTFRFNRRTSRSRGLLFYRLLQNAVALPPVTASQIRGVEDLALLPVLGRDEVQTTPIEEMLTRGLDPKRLARVRTSGSTGLPVTVYLGQRELDRRTWASRYRSRAVLGCPPWAKRMDILMPRPIRWWQRPARHFSDVRVDKRLPVREILGQIRKFKLLVRQVES